MWSLVYTTIQSSFLVWYSIKYMGVLIVFMISIVLKSFFHMCDLTRCFNFLRYLGPILLMFWLYLMLYDLFFEGFFFIFHSRISSTLSFFLRILNTLHFWYVSSTLLDWFALAGSCISSYSSKRQDWNPKGCWICSFLLDLGAFTGGLFAV